MTTDLAHRQPPIGGETTQTEPTPAPDGTCGCSVQRNCSDLFTGKTLKERVWEGTFFENLSKEHFTKEGKVKLRFNQNTPTILLGHDGRLVQLSPDNVNDLLPQAEAEFYQGEVAPPEVCRQIWDVAEKNLLLSSQP